MSDTAGGPTPASPDARQTVEPVAAERQRRPPGGADAAVDADDSFEEADTKPVAPVELPPPVPVDSLPPSLAQRELFDAEKGRLARGGAWADLASLLSDALDHAPWATPREVRAALLLDLAQLRRDRLENPAGALNAYEKIVEVDPAHPDAVDAIAEHYRAVRDPMGLYRTYLAAAKARWDPAGRVSLARQAAAAALEAGQADQAIAAWQSLWDLGERDPEVERELARAYRATRAWDELSAFLTQRYETTTGGEKTRTGWDLLELQAHARERAELAIDTATELLRADPSDPLASSVWLDAQASIGSWAPLMLHVNGLEDPELLADAARLLHDGGKHDAALGVCRRLRKAGELPPRLEALEESCLRDSTAPDALVDMLLRRAEEATGDAERVEHTLKAADVVATQLNDADRAAELWHGVLEIDPRCGAASDALVARYEAVGDRDAIVRTLEAQLEVSHEAAVRKRLLRQLGGLHGEMGEDALAERRLHELLQLDPGDTETVNAYCELYEQRGDHAALDAVLTQRIHRSGMSAAGLDLRLRAARNAEEHLADPSYVAAAWQRVLDVAPTDREALDAASDRAAQLEQWRLQLAYLEEAEATTQDAAIARARAMDIAAGWEIYDQPAVALARYERLIKTHDGDPKPLEMAARLWTDMGHQGIAAALLEQAATLSETRDQRAKLLRLAAEALPSGRTRERLALLRRILEAEELAGDEREALLDELADTAMRCEAPAVLAATLDQLMRAADAPEAREALRERLVATLTEAGAAERAWVVGQAPLLNAEAIEGRLDALAKLAVASGRVEDYLGLMDAWAEGADLREKRAALERQADLASTVLADPARAIELHRRRLALDPTDLSGLGAIEKLADDHGLWDDVDDVCGWLLDQLRDEDLRNDVLRRREHARANSDGSSGRALEVVIVRLREPGLGPDRDAVIGRANALEAWDQLLPVLSASETARGELADPDALTGLARLDVTHGSKDRALSMLAQALRVLPTHAGAAEAVEELALEAPYEERAALALRMAAARARQLGQDADALRLLNSVVDVSEGQPQAQLEAHRAILQLDPRAFASIEAVMEAHRERDEWSSVRDLMTQWITHAPDTTPKAERWLEVADICLDKLDDVEGALGAYSALLKVEPNHEAALAGLAKLRDTATTPRLQVRILRAELAAATAEEAPELALRVAALHAGQLGEPSAAIEVLSELVADRGPSEPCLSRLCDLLRAHGRWEQLATLLERRSEDLQGDERVALLDEVAALWEDELFRDSGPDLERLARTLLELEPASSGRVVRMLRLLGTSGRWEELASLLGAAAEHASGVKRFDVLKTQARVLHLGLDDQTHADALLAQLLREQPEDQAVLLALADRAQASGDWLTYVELREAQAAAVPEPEAALVLCHLAEVCEEVDGLERNVVPLYRRARQLDRGCAPASEALRAFGRRERQLRPAAALLPEAGERELTFEQRADRLVTLAQRSADEAEALEWLRRAVTVAPHHQQAWELIAERLETLGDSEGALHARYGALWAFEWRSLPDRDGQAEQARLLEAAARAARDRAGLFEWLMHKAHQIDPLRPGPALEAARVVFDEGDTYGATELISKTLQRRRARSVSVDAGDVELYCRQAELFVQLGRFEDALIAYRQALDIDHLSARALGAAAETLRLVGRPITAARFAVRALLVVEDAVEQGRMNNRLAHLLESDLGRREEALACVERALHAGVVDPAAVWRALELYRKAGDHEAALRLADVLTRSADAPDQLAALWTTRGQIHLGRDPQDAAALDAFEMALSYDPESGSALMGLADALEARGETEALTGLLEPLLASDNPQERGAVLDRLARAANRRGDQDEEAYRLRELVDIAPNADRLERLERIYRADPEHLVDAVWVAAQRLSYGAPFAERLHGLVRDLVALGAGRAAYALSTPLRRVSRLDNSARDLFEQLRSEFEGKADYLPVSREAQRALYPNKALLPLTELLAEIEDALPDMASAVRPVGKLVRVGPTTGHGAVAHQVLEALGMPPREVFRLEAECEEAFLGVYGDPPGAVIRGDLLHKLVHAPAAFVIGWGLMISRRGALVMSARSWAERRSLMDAIHRALGIRVARVGGHEVGERATEDAHRLREGLGKARLAEWRERLQGMGAPETLLERWWKGECDYALMVSAAMVGNLRVVFRAMRAIHPRLPQLKTALNFEGLDHQIVRSEAFQEVVALATRAQVTTAFTGL